jgi:hypothetical protein
MQQKKVALECVTRGAMKGDALECVTRGAGKGVASEHVTRGAAKGDALELGTSSEATLPVALEHGKRGTMKGVALGVNNNNSESQMDVAWVAHSDSNRVGTIDDGINYVDEDAY